jgi:hypothetical protein
MQQQYLNPKDKHHTINLGRPPSSRRTISSSRSARSIDAENKRITGKINNAKSNYSKFREKEHTSALKLRGSRDELLNLLVNQFGVKPSVLFPKPGKQSLPGASSSRSRADSSCA